MTRAFWSLLLVLVTLSVACTTPRTAGPAITAAPDSARSSTHDDFAPHVFSLTEAQDLLEMGLASLAFNGNPSRWRALVRSYCDELSNAISAAREAEHSTVLIGPGELSVFWDAVAQIIATRPTNEAPQASDTAQDTAQLPANPWELHEQGLVEEAVEIAQGILAEEGLLSVANLELAFATVEWLTAMDDLGAAISLLANIEADLEVGTQYEQQADYHRYRIEARMAGEDPLEQLLAEATTAEAEGDFDRVISTLALLDPHGLSPEQAGVAARLLDNAKRQRRNTIDDIIDAVEANLETPGPYEEAALLLGDLSLLDPGADRDGPLADLRRRLDEANLRLGAQAVIESQGVGDTTVVSDLLAEGKYDEAIATADRLMSRNPQLRTELEELRDEAIDGAVRTLRDEASQAFAKAKRMRSKPEDARAELERARALIEKAIDRYPETSYLRQLEANLASIESELERLP